MSTKGALLLSFSILMSVIILSATALHLSQRLTNQPTASAATSETRAFANDRYDLREYRHGNTAGEMLVDKATGRVWVYTDAEGSGLAFRDAHFREVGIDQLWDDPPSALSVEGLVKSYYEDQGKTDADRAKEAEEAYVIKQKVRQLTRPDAVIRAEAEARKKVLDKAAVSLKP